MTYDEFVTARDPHGGFIVQERHQQAGFGTAVSAVAVGDGTHRVTLTAATVTPGAAITVRTDGTVIARNAFTTGDLSVSSESEPRSWTVGFPDGSAVEAKWNEGFFVTVEPSAARAPRIVGLLGTPGSTFLDDLAMPDGSRAVPVDGYVAFVQAWWVTDPTTLFDYDSGQNTETFRVVPPAVPITVPAAATVAVCQQGLGAAAAPASSAVASAGPTGQPGSTLTLQGTFARLTNGTVNDKITGTMQLVAGTVLLARMQCPTDPAFQLVLSATDTTGGGISTPCAAPPGMGKGTTRDPTTRATSARVTS